MEKRTAEDTATTCLIGDRRREWRLPRELVDFVGILLILDTIEEVLEIQREREREGNDGVGFGGDTSNGGEGTAGNRAI